MPYVNRNARLAFLAHPRAASHSIARALQEQAGFKVVGAHHGPRAEVEAIHPESTGWTFFCVVRNPYDALVSWWWKRGKRDGHEFSVAWIEMLERQMGVERPRGNPTLVRPGQLWVYADDSDAVIRYERLDADVNELLEAHGLNPVELPWDVQSARMGQPYAEHYDEATRAWVAEHYADELRTWGYGWQEIVVTAVR